VAGHDGYGKFVRDRYRSGDLDRHAWLELVAEHGRLLRSGPGEEEALLGEVEKLVDASDRLWPAIALSLQVDVCRSILRRLPVRAGLLDGFVLRRAIRGGPLPDPEDYIEISDEHLAAVNEAGPLPPPAKKRVRR
jgi:hypothetical protein